jgi:hypothetical protein
VTQEKRKGNTPLPDNLEAVLSEAQRRALPGLEVSGWKPRFLRRPLFQEPELVIYNPVDHRAGVLGVDGVIRVQASIPMREQDAHAFMPDPDEEPVWTK